MTCHVDPERQKILQAASDLFERYGYRKTTIEDIANEAGIGKGSVYLRYASKEEIGMAWLAQIHGGLWSAVEEAASIDPPTAALRKILVSRVMDRFDIFAKHRRSMDEALSTLKPLVEERKRAFHEREAALLADVIRRGTVGRLFVSSDPLQDARSMILATNSLLPYSLRPDQIGDRPTVLENATRLADLLVRSVEVNRG